MPLTLALPTMNNRILFGLLFALVAALPAKAQVTPDDTRDLLQLNTITTAVPFLMIAPDSRSGAMGDVGVALSPDANSLHWNPAKMAFIEDEMEFGLSYAPWLRQLVDDMNLAYVSSVRRLNDRQAYGVALRYFSLGNITFTDDVGTTIRDFQPAELSLDGGFSQKFSDKFSGGFSARFIHSNLTGGTSVQGADSRPGISVAADLSMYYVNDRANWGKSDGIFRLGMNMSNLGAKMSYTETAERDFIPANLRLGSSYETLIDDYNSVTFALDLNKLLVPTQPIYGFDTIQGRYIISGMDPNVGVTTGLVQSFYDAPGIVTTDAVTGESFVQKGSIWREELREINISTGLEYNFDDVFAFRTGYFFEHFSKGNRQFITLGAGVKYTVFTVDFSYLISTTQQNPLANTLRFSLRLQFDDLDEYLSEE